jgi:SAM-dependent methyltransferase
MKPPAPAHDPATLAFYAKEAATYATSFPPGPNRHLDRFLELLPAGARILELGCGAGRDTAAMLARGFDVDPTDATAGLARRAEALTGQPVRAMRFDELDAVERYDAVWAHACLLHVPRRALVPVLERIFRALRPGGVHFANFKAGGSEGRDGLGRYFNYLTLEQALAAYRDSAGWEVIGTDEYVGGGYDNKETPWIAVMLRKPIPSD